MVPVPGKDGNGGESVAVLSGLFLIHQFKGAKHKVRFYSLFMEGWL